MTNLLLVPVDDAVVFPNMNITLPVDVGEEKRVILVPRHESRYGAIGVVADIVEQVRLPGGGRAVAVIGLHRGLIGTASTDTAGQLRVDVDERPDEPPGGAPTGRLRELEREYRAVVEEILELRGDDGRISAFVRSITEAGVLADTAGYSPDLTFEEKIELLETLDVTERLELALRLQRERLTELQVRSRIRDDVQSGAEKQQREYFLRKQMESIRRELGRLERMGDTSPEAQTIRTYLDWLLAVPWAKRSEERLDPKHAREVLDADHAGLEDVKDRIVEYLAVRKLRSERGIHEDKRSGASSSACRSAASATRPRSAATDGPTSARCPAGSCVRSATPGR